MRFRGRLRRRHRGGDRRLDEVGQRVAFQRWPVAFGAGPDMLRGHPADGTILVQQDADEDALIALSVGRRPVSVCRPVRTCQDVRTRRGVRTRRDASSRWGASSPPRGSRLGEFPGLVAPGIDLRRADIGQHRGNLVPGAGRKAGIGPDARGVQPCGSPRPDCLDPRQVVGAGHIIALAQVSRHGDLLVRAGRRPCVKPDRPGRACTEALNAHRFGA